MNSFETKTELMAHQREAVAKLLPARVGALFMDMGTGKSRTAIELVKIRRRKIDRVVWFCPVSLKQTVREEILKHSNSTDADIHVFNEKTSESDLPREFWIVCGIESMSSSDRVVLAIHKLIDERTFLIIDESSFIKGHRSMRTQRLTSYGEKARYRLVLTGTPLTQGVVDLYAQMRFLSPKILKFNSFYSFARNHLEYSARFPGMIVRVLNEEQLAAKIAPYTYQVTKEECLDLPKKVYTSRYFGMTAAQRAAYELAKLELLMDVPDDYLDSSIAIFRLFSALQQITCGFWNKSDWQPHWMGKKRKEKTFELFEYNHQRIQTLIETLREIPPFEKVIIWAKFLYDIKQIEAALEIGFPNEKIAFFHGKLSEKERSREVEKFRSSARFFVATPSSGGHGLTLNEASYVIFYNNGFKYSERLQAEDRNHRIGQTKSVTYIDIVCSNSIDERINKALLKKESVVESFRREIQKVKKEKLRERLMKL